MHRPPILGFSSRATASQTVCARCGLRVEIVDMGEQPHIRYDFAVWDGVCDYPLLGGPSACLKMQARGRQIDPDTH